VILSFADETTAKIFRGDPLTRKEERALGNLRIKKAYERLLLLNAATEKDLLLYPALHYHSLKGTTFHCVDADARNSKWRITFAWADQALTDVSLVTIEDTH